ncbi:MAG: ribbon-helix-helix domain-containing protein [Verrucomicrobiota bacterium JB022]|nr:ribbon-helix-helix domain-containing protein [Verrucomicrobiota bacterium JB022]
MPKKDAEPTTQLSVRIPTAVAERLDEICTRTRRTRSNVVNALLEQYVEAYTSGRGSDIYPDYAAGLPSVTLPPLKKSGKKPGTGAPLPEGTPAVHERRKRLG